MTNERGDGIAAVVILWFVIVGLLLFSGGVIVGSVVGFNVAMKQLSSCDSVPCSQLGLDVGDNMTTCEVCQKGAGYKILRRGSDK